MSSSFYSQIGIPSSNSTAIQSSVNQAATSETNAATSATNSASSAAASAASATSANAADVSATQSKNAAEAAQVAALGSSQQAASHASTGLNHANNAAASAVTANTEATNAALSALTSTTQATNAAASAASAAADLAAIGTSVTDAATSATSAASTLATFQNQYLGAAATAPTQDPDGSALDLGDLWFDTASDTLKVYASGGWVNAGSSVNGTSERQTYVATAGQTTFSVTYDAGFVDVWLNGVKLLVGTDFTATSGTNIVLASGAAVNDIIDIIAFGTFVFTNADHYTKTQADARFEPLGGGGSGYGDSSVDTHLNQSSATSGQYLKWNGSDYAWDTVAGGYANSDVDLHLNQASATSGQYLQWNGSDYAWAAVAAGYTDSDVDAHLLTAGVTLDATNDRIGIGTSSPSEELHIATTGGATAGIQIGTAGGTVDRDYKILVSSSAGSLFIQDATASVNRIALDSSGNVGIGTTSPDSPLEIQATTNSSSDTTYLKLYNAGENVGSIDFENGNGSLARITGTKVGAGAGANDGILTFSTAFDTSLSEAMRIDSSGNLLVGTTSLGNADTGVEARANGTLTTTSDSQTALFVKRIGSGSNDDGELIRLQNADGTIGSIGSNGGDVYIGNPDESLIRFGNNQIAPANNTGADRDNAIDIGGSGGRRFKDLFLSNNVMARNFVGTGDTDTFIAMTGSNVQRFFTYGSERARLDASGNFLVGKNSYGITNTGVTLLPNGIYSTSTGVPMYLNRNGSSGTILEFRTNNSTSGYIYSTTGSVSYNTSSDYRLKENVTDVTDGITRVKQLAPKRFNFIADADRIVDGFLAHEAATVVPEAVTGEKDAMKDEEYEVTAAKGDVYTPATDAVLDEEGNEVSAATDEVIHSSNVEQPETLEEGQQWRETTAVVMGTRSVPDMQGIDQSKLVPLLTAALQEAIAKIETLETQSTTQATQIADLTTRLEALEAN